MLVPNRHGSSNSYRYGFQGQEKDDELKGEGNSLNYTFRMHDPRVGRFFATDPLTADYPHYTPYSFSGNKVIAFTELEGMEEFSIHHRSFAPWKLFGDIFGFYQGTFSGDYRGFSLLDHSGETGIRAKLQGMSSSRIYQMAKINISSYSKNKGEGVKESYVLNSRTEGNTNFVGTHNSGFSNSSGKASFSNRKLEMQFEGSDPLVAIRSNDKEMLSLAPDIDWKTTIDFNKVTDNLVQINAKINGKGFPAYESFIEDSAGTRAFIKTISAPNKLNLGKELLNPFYDVTGQVKLRFELDRKGNFTGKMYTHSITYKTYLNEKGKTEYEKIDVWTETTINEWNKLNESKPAAPDANN